MKIKVINDKVNIQYFQYNQLSTIFLRRYTSINLKVQTESLREKGSSAMRLATTLAWMHDNLKQIVRTLDDEVTYHVSNDIDNCLHALEDNYNMIGEYGKRLIDAAHVYDMREEELLTMFDHLEIETLGNIYVTQDIEKQVKEQPNTVVEPPNNFWTTSSKQPFDDYSREKTPSRAPDTSTRTFHTSSETHMADGGGANKSNVYDNNHIFYGGLDYSKPVYVNPVYGTKTNNPNSGWPELEVFRSNIDATQTVLSILLNTVAGDIYDLELIIIGYDFEEKRWASFGERVAYLAFAAIPGSSKAVKEISQEAAEKIIKEAGEELFEKAAKETGEEILEKGIREGTTNLYKNADLLDELANTGVKYNPDDLLAITKTTDGKLVWLETGSSKAGMQHILNHADDFAKKGISEEQIQDLVMESLTNGKIVGYQGRGTGRPIYEVLYEGNTYHTAITVGDNGFIVGANPTTWN